MSQLALSLLFTTVSGEFNLPPNLLAAVCFVETRHNVNAYQPNDAGTPSIGICQVKFATAVGLGYHGDAQGLRDPRTNVYYAGKYLAYQVRRYKGNYEKAVIAYNMGSAKNLQTTKYSATVFKQYVQMAVGEK